MQNMKKLAVAGAVLSALVIVGGCAGGYDENYYGSNGSRSDRDREQYWHNDNDREANRYDRNDRDDSRRDDSRRDDSRRDDSRRVRVCDADGDNCHWEYRER